MFSVNEQMWSKRDLCATLNIVVFKKNEREVKNICSLKSHATLTINYTTHSN